MATSYDVIYDRFALKINDFNLPSMDDEVLSEMLLGWLIAAAVKNRKCEHDLSKRNDVTQVFEEDLSDLEIELLALRMRGEWLNQYLHSTENVLQFFGGKEEKWFSQASHIAEVRALSEQNDLEINRLHNYYTYTNNSYFQD